jgi:hypothetical protein
MNDKKSWGTTVLGWFVVRPEDEAGASGAGDGGTEHDPAAAAGGHYDAYAADQPVTPAPAFVSEPPAAVGGNVDFAAVYAAAGIDDEEQARVSKAAALLASLPAATEPAVKKQIVEASLKAFGVPIDLIIENGVQEIQALEGYIQAGAADTQQLLAESQARIAQFEAEVQRIRQVMDERVTEQAAVMRACNAKKLDVQRVLEFFGQEAVARVVHASPKLVEPEAGA